MSEKIIFFVKLYSQNGKNEALYELSKKNS